MRCSSRILVAVNEVNSAVARYFALLSLGACEGNRRLRRPVKGAPLRGRAELALDRPTHQFWDGHKEMG